MKRLMLIPLLCLATAGFADELHNFAEIKSAIISGQQIRIVTNFAKCTSTTEATPGMPVGVFVPTAIQILDKRILTSFVHFTLNNLNSPESPVNEYVKYSINDDEKVIVTYQTLDARNYSPVAEIRFYTCKLEVGAKVYI